MPNTTRVACIRVAHLPVQVECCLEPTLAHMPLIVGGRPWDAGAVLDCCPRAAAAGVHPGMRLALAERLCPAARFVPAREERYRAAHDALLAAARRFTTTVESADLGLIYAEVSGLQMRFGSEARLAAQLVWAAEQALQESLGQLPSPWAQVGLGNCKFVAEQAACAARPGGSCVVPAGEERAFLSPLPLSALPADPEMQRRLYLLGVRTLGALAALPRLAVVRQFGPRAGPLHDLACGVDSRPVHPAAPPLALERSRTFDNPLVERAPLLACVTQIAAELAEMLARRGYQAEGIQLRLESTTGVAHTAGAQVKPPSADTALLSRLAARLLGRLAPAAAVVALSLTVYPLRPFHLGATQLALYRGALDVVRDVLHSGPSSFCPEPLVEALRLLRARFGEAIILIASLLGPPRPRPIQVTTDPSGQPLALVWPDRIRGVTAIYEAWRERRRWWSLPIERDYFRLETCDGEVRTLFRDLRSGEWMLERRRL